MYTFLLNPRKMEQLILKTISRHIKAKKVIKGSQHVFTNRKLCSTTSIEGGDDMIK